jgi:nitroimidazol reductase NimA-like FMN-containing flavoprotein (pyridoxamine 5'-phosphate oxidase superfamily)
MSFATIRSDGYPQATTVAYANDGLALYFACDRDSQKVRNIGKSKKVSMTIDRETKDWSKIKGLSMAATAEVQTKPADVKRGLKILARKFPEMGDMSEEDLAATAVVKVTPKVISVINYTKGFGHTDLVRV